jgi:hypothetical protein
MTIPTGCGMYRLSCVTLELANIRVWSDVATAQTCSVRLARLNVPIRADIHWLRSMFRWIDPFAGRVTRINWDSAARNILLLIVHIPVPRDAPAEDVDSS